MPPNSDDPNGKAGLGDWRRRKTAPRTDVGPVRLKRLKYKGSGGPYVLVLFKNADGRVFAEDGIFGDEDLFNLLL
jgi:hypothetical protein